MEIFLLIVIGIIILIVKGVSKGKKTTESWEMAAEAMDLSFQKSQGGWHTLSGIINGLQVSAKQAPSTQGNSRAPSIRYSAMLPKALPFEIRITPSRFSSVVQNRTAHRFNMDDRAFDSEFIVESRDPTAVRAFLDRDKRNLLRNLFERFDDLTLTEAGLVVSRHIPQADESRLVRDMTRLVKDTREIFLAQPKGAEKPTPPPLPKEEKKNKKKPEVPVEVTEADITEPAETPAAIIKEHTAEIEEMVPEPLKSSPVEEAPVSEPEAVSTPVVPEVKLTPTESVIAAFADVSNRYEFQKAFNEELKDTEYEGVLHLTGVERYSMDRLLGRGPGIRATFELGETGEGETLTLVAALHDASQLGAMRSEVGNEFPIYGKLIACDSFENTLFLMTPAPDKPEPALEAATTSYAYTPYASKIG